MILALQGKKRGERRRRNGTRSAVLSVFKLYGTRRREGEKEKGRKKEKGVG